MAMAISHWLRQPHHHTSDAAGNFALTNLPVACTGPQLIDFDGTTATALARPDITPA